MYAFISSLVALLRGKIDLLWPALVALALGACAGETGGQLSAAVDGGSPDQAATATDVGVDTTPSYSPTDTEGPTRYDKVFGEDQIHDLTITYRPGEWDRQQA
ncbi:MAG TPA: hypothetical protein DCQ06_01890, partial [Myxococcales bacterium]|nr:hypothetical protein [Myxococcales bacterium]